MSYISNIKNALSTITQLSNGPKESEIKSFSIRGYLMDDKTQIYQEMCKIYGIFAHDIEIKDEVKRKYLYKFLDDMDILCDSIDYSDDIKVEAFKKVIVYFQMEVGISLSFYQVFVDMMKNNELENIDYVNKKVNCNEMYYKFYNNLVIEKNINLNMNNNQSYDVYDKNYYVSNIHNIINVLSDFEESYAAKYYNVLNQLCDFINASDLSEEDVLFISYITSYVESKLLMKQSYVYAYEFVELDDNLLQQVDELFKNEIISLNDIHELFKARSKGKRL